jgi:unsaturated rhamnogalacturonyl hydrolase
VARKAYQGILDTFIVEKGDKMDIIQSCASAGLGPASNPSRTGTVNYYLCGKDVGTAINEGKAIGSLFWLRWSMSWRPILRQLSRPVRLFRMAG